MVSTLGGHGPLLQTPFAAIPTVHSREVCWKAHPLTYTRGSPQRCIGAAARLQTQQGFASRYPSMFTHVPVNCSTVHAPFEQSHRGLLRNMLPRVL
jgi:hypothetical protein